jgi:hypothetical protein
MRNLNQKQKSWVMNNTPIGTVLSSTEESTIKIVDHEPGCVIVQTTLTDKVSEENYNMGLITKEELLSGNPKITTRLSRFLYNSPVWKTYFPELLNIKSK